jgi:hypothetical protein
MADLFEIGFIIAFHFNGHPVFKQVFFLGQQLIGHGPQALFGKLAVSRAAKIHFGIDEPVTTAAALAGGVIFEKFDRLIALGALDFKYGPRLPVFGILSRAFHDAASSCFCGSVIVGCIDCSASGRAWL